MAADNEVAVNSLNSQLSAGPLSGQDATESTRKTSTHGLTAEWMLLEGEDRGRFQSLCEDLRSEYQPVARIEECWVLYLATALWRLGRAPIFEAALLVWSRHSSNGDHSVGARNCCACQSTQPPLDAENPAVHLGIEWGRALDLALTKGGPLTKLARHEGHLLRQIEQTLKLLRDAKKEREERQAEVAEVQVYLVKQ